MRTKLLVIALFMLTCFGATAQCHPVKIISATVRHWTSGAPGGRSGDKYTIKIQIQSSHKIEFGHVWLGPKNVPFNLELFAQETQQRFKQGDSILLTYNTIDNSNVSSKLTKQLPIKYKGEALIEYFLNGHARYLVVKRFDRLTDKSSQ